jgi:hypothetical protein
MVKDRPMVKKRHGLRSSKKLAHITRKFKFYDELTRNIGPDKK